jgi:hypothetical protein
MKRRPIIRTLAQISAFDSSIIVSGSFKISGNEHISVVTRTNAVPWHYDQTQDGLQFCFSNEHPRSITVFYNRGTNYEPACSSVNWSPHLFTWYRFQIIDGGSFAKVSINGEIVLNCLGIDTTYYPGPYIAIYNRHCCVDDWLYWGPMNITAGSSTISTRHSSSACIACAAGAYNPSTGNRSSESCIACSAGTYNPSTGSSSSTACISCVAGTFSTLGQSACTTCAAGSYNPSSGSVSPSDCTACAAGTYNPHNSSRAAPVPPSPPPSPSPQQRASWTPASAHAAYTYTCTC